MHAHEAPAGVRAVTAYKAIKGAAQLLTSLVLLALLATHRVGRLDAFVARTRESLVHPWSQHLADAILRDGGHRWIELVMLALAFDGTLSAIEGWALHRGETWGRWLVVFSTSTLLPFEIYELSKHVRVSRVCVLALNVVIVVYLAFRARSEQSGRPTHARP